MEKQKHKFHEDHRRSIAKTITYRVVIVISTFIAASFVTPDIKTAAEVTTIANIVNTFIYYLHERIWNNVHWGRSHKHHSN